MFCQSECKYGSKCLWFRRVHRGGVPTCNNNYYYVNISTKGVYVNIDEYLSKLQVLSAKLKKQEIIKSVFNGSS
jgi:hypothetical protein